MSQPFTVTITTDQEAYTEGQVVSFVVEVCNTGPPTITEGFGGSDIPFSFSVRAADGTNVADDSHEVHTLELRTVRWGEGQCRHATRTWDQHYWNRREDQPTEAPDLWAFLWSAIGSRRGSTESRS